MAVRHINMHPGPPTLQTIPLELQWKIFESLDYQSAVFLTATSHFYKSSPKSPLSFKSSAERLAFLTAAENFPQNKDRYGCFSCQTIKPHDQFAIKQITKKYKKRNARSGARFCLDCGVSKNIYTRGQQVQKSDGNNYWKCCSCNHLKRHEFCFVCTKCSDCLSLPNGFGGNGCPSCGERWNTEDHDNSG
jgi:hypothetical protein